VEEDDRIYSVILPRVFALSTDYKDATNAFPQRIAGKIAKFWMETCGIPSGIRKLVMELYAPRWLEFTQTENLDDLGEHTRTDDKCDVRRVKM
jgi:hypothetical protein